MGKPFRRGRGLRVQRGSCDSQVETCDERLVSKPQEQKSSLSPYKTGTSFTRCLTYSTRHIKDSLRSYDRQTPHDYAQYKANRCLS